MRMSLSLAVAACAAILCALTGCDRKSEVAPMAPAPAPSPVTAPALAQESPAAPTESEIASLPVGNEKDDDGNYICMVKGIPIKDLSKAEKVVYDGILFYLDCPGSKRKFELDPGGYITGEIERVDCGGKRECEEDIRAAEAAKAAATGQPVPEPWSAPESEQPKSGE